MTCNVPGFQDIWLISVFVHDPQHDNQVSQLIVIFIDIKLGTLQKQASFGIFLLIRNYGEIVGCEMYHDGENQNSPIS